MVLQGSLLLANYYCLFFVVRTKTYFIYFYFILHRGTAECLNRIGQQQRRHIILVLTLQHGSDCNSGGNMNDKLVLMRYDIASVVTANTQTLTQQKLHII